MGVLENLGALMGLYGARRRPLGYYDPEDPQGTFAQTGRAMAPGSQQMQPGYQPKYQYDTGWRFAPGYEDVPQQQADYGRLARPMGQLGQARQTFAQNSQMFGSAQRNKPRFTDGSEYNRKPKKGVKK